jgi:hypothetical protein
MALSTMVTSDSAIRRMQVSCFEWHPDQPSAPHPHWKPESHDTKRTTLTITGFLILAGGWYLLRDPSTPAREHPLSQPWLERWSNQN